MSQTTFLLSDLFIRPIFNTFRAAYEKAFGELADRRAITPKQFDTLSDGRQTNWLTFSRLAAWSELLPWIGRDTAWIDTASN